MRGGEVAREARKLKKPGRAAGLVVKEAFMQPGKCIWNAACAAAACVVAGAAANRCAPSHRALCTALHRYAGAGGGGAAARRGTAAGGSDV